LKKKNRKSLEYNIIEIRIKTENKIEKILKKILNCGQIIPKTIWMWTK
jgi:hypothetical protein